VFAQSYRLRTASNAAGFWPHLEAMARAWPVLIESNLSRQTVDDRIQLMIQWLTPLRDMIRKRLGDADGCIAPDKSIGTNND
jgi:hypothetical protein